MADAIMRWDLVQLRCSNFMGCMLAQRLALASLELAGSFAVDEPRGLPLTVSTQQRILPNQWDPRGRE